MTSLNIKNECAIQKDIQKVSDLSIDKNLSVKLKGIAILLVILGHMNYIDCGGAWGVHLFLIISGYGIAVSLEKNGSQEYWIKRIKSVYFPYLLATVLFLIVRIILGEKLSLLSVTISLFGFDFGLNSDPTMWYISYAFAWYAVAWILYLLKDKKYFCIGIAVIMIFFIAFLGYTAVIWRRGTIAWAYFASFPLGMLLAKYRNKQLSLFLKNTLLSIMVCFCLLIVVLDYRKFHSGAEEFVFSFSAALGILFICIMLNSVIKVRFGGVVRKIGALSYFMYLNEGFLLQHKDKFAPFENIDIQNVCILIFSIILACCMKYIWKALSMFMFKGRMNNVKNFTGS